MNTKDVDCRLSSIAVAWIVH